VKERLVELAKQSSIYTVGSFAGPLIGLFMVPVYTRIFSPDDYGVIDLIQVVVSLAIAILILGTDNATGRYYVDPDNVPDRKTIASTSMFFRVSILGVGSVLLILFAGEISQSVFGSSKYARFLVIALATVPFNLCFILCQNLLRYNFRSVNYTLLSVGKLLVNVSLAIWLVVFLGWGIMGVFTAMLISAIVFLAVSLIYTAKYFSFTFSLSWLRELLSYGIPLVPYSLTVYLIHNCDRYFLVNYSTLEQVGLYALGMRLASLVSFLFIGTGVAWAPMFYSIYKRDDARELYHRVANYSVAATVLGVVAISLFAKEMLMILSTSDYYGAYIVVPILGAYMAFYHLGLRMSQGINIAKKTVHFTWISIVTAVVNIGLNFLLVPRYGMLGAALATLACAMVWCILLVYMSQRYYHIDYNYSAFLKALLVSTVVIVSVYLFLPNVNWQSTLIKLGLLAVVSASLYLFNLIGKPEIEFLVSLLAKLRGKIGR